MTPHVAVNELGAPNLKDAMREVQISNSRSSEDFKHLTASGFPTSHNATLEAVLRLASHSPMEYRRCDLVDCASCKALDWDILPFNEAR